MLNSSFNVTLDRQPSTARKILDLDADYKRAYNLVEHKRVYADAHHANGESTSKNEVWNIALKCAIVTVIYL